MTDEPRQERTLSERNAASRAEWRGPDVELDADDLAGHTPPASEQDGRLHDARASTAGLAPTITPPD
jgi:hypothetical protein